MKKFRNNKLIFRSKSAIMLVIFMMIIGYASVVTILDLKGSVAIGFNFDDVNIYIANLYNNNINRYNSIGENKMEFNLEIEKGTSNIDLYVANNAVQYDESITLTCNNAELNGVTVTPAEGNVNTISSQLIMKSTYVINNTGEKQTIKCRIENEEVEVSETTETKKKIIFAADGYENPTAYKYVDTLTYGELPVLTKENYEFLGWYDINDNLITSETEIQTFSDEVLFAKFEDLQAIKFFYDNSKTGINCDNIQCAITKLNELVEGVR